MVINCCSPWLTVPCPTPPTFEFSTTLSSSSLRDCALTVLYYLIFAFFLVLSWITFIKKTTTTQYKLLPKGGGGTLLWHLFGFKHQQSGFIPIQVESIPVEQARLVPECSSVPNKSKHFLLTTLRPQSCTCLGGPEHGTSNVSTTVTTTHSICSSERGAVNPSNSTSPCFYGSVEVPVFQRRQTSFLIISLRYECGSGGTPTSYLRSIKEVYLKGHSCEDE